MEIININDIRENLDSFVSTHLYQNKNLCDKDFVFHVLNFEKQLEHAYKESYIY